MTSIIALSSQNEDFSVTKGTYQCIQSSSQITKISISFFKVCCCSDDFLPSKYSSVFYANQCLSIKSLNTIQLIEVLIHATEDIDRVVVQGTAAMTKSFLIEFGSNLPLVGPYVILLNTTLANKIIKPLIIVVIVAAT